MRDIALVLDASLTVRMDLSDAFEAEGFHSYPCSTLEEARKSAGQFPPQVIVLDTALAAGEAVSFLAELRASENPPVVLLLGAEGDSPLEGGEGGCLIKSGNRPALLLSSAQECFPKPYESEAVAARGRLLVGAQRAAALVRGERPTLLLIDDSITVREELCGALEQAGYEVMTADNGEEGLRLAAIHRPSALVVDGHLPGIDGATVIRRIRLDSALRTTPCILLTGSQDRTAELATLDAGADAFVHKDDQVDVLLARVAAVLRSSAKSLEPKITSVLTARKILAVDDSETYLQAISEALESEGFVVTQARSGEEALESLAIESVDCILLDMVMPGLDGCETCRRIKSATAVRDIPLIVLTSRDDHESMMEGFGAGADDYSQHRREDYD